MPTIRAAPPLTCRFGPLSVDVPRSAGYFGGVALAVGAGLIEPPLGLFIAAVPFVRMIDTSAPRMTRFVGQFLEGMSKPVGGDSEGTITRRPSRSPSTPARRRRTPANGRAH